MASQKAKISIAIIMLKTSILVLAKPASHALST
jgi:hypothetical protein